jgi:hypothetical protein
LAVLKLNTLSLLEKQKAKEIILHLMPHKKQQAILQIGDLNGIPFQFGREIEGQSHAVRIPGSLRALKQLFQAPNRGVQPRGGRDDWMPSEASQPPRLKG